MVELEIDDQAISVEEGTSIIEAADKLGIYIPRFCYHPELSIAANCRMCLIEVEGSHKPLPACATPVTDNMKVYTSSKMVLGAQKAVMEFLLINHPLDCPICDQGGMCELQDTAMGYGAPETAFAESKVPTYSPDIGPLIDTEMTRCIKCTRCVRFGEEIAGLRELGVINRGENSEISTYLQHFVRSELSGNVIDLCPVGALNAKPSRYHARGWEMKEHPSIAPHDCVGSHVFIHCRRHNNHEPREILGVVPRTCPSINESWISDRDRFSYDALNHSERVLEPMIKQKGQWLTVSWQRALVEIADKFRSILNHHGGEQLAALASPSSTVEELYVLQKLFRAMGSNNIDHRIHQSDVNRSSMNLADISMSTAIADVQALDAFLLIGSDVRIEQPILSHHMNQAVQSGACAMRVDVRRHRTLFPVNHDMVQLDVVLGLAAIVKALKGGESLAALKDIEVTPTAKAMAKQLTSAEKGAVFIGELAMSHAQSMLVRQLAQLIAKHSQCDFNVLSIGANSVGAHLAGAIPHAKPAGELIDKAGLNASQLLGDDAVKAYLLLGAEPELDSAYSESACQSLKQASMVVSLSPFAGKATLEYADFILPIAPFGENTGTLINAEARWQTVHAASVPQGGAKPAWKVLRALAGFMMCDGFEYHNEHQIIDELKQQVDAMSVKETADTDLPAINPLVCNELRRIPHTPLYSRDGLVRRSQPLQDVANDDEACIAINLATAKRLLLVEGDLTIAKQGNGSVRLPLRIDDALADDAVSIPSGCLITSGFGRVSAPIILTQEAV